MVTVQVFLGPRLVPVQVSAVLANAEAPGRVIFSAELAALPELARVKVLAAAWPAARVP